MLKLTRTKATFKKLSETLKLKLSIIQYCLLQQSNETCGLYEIFQRINWISSLIDICGCAEKLPNVMSLEKETKPKKNIYNLKEISKTPKTLA